jgi:hypothetical protein
MDVILLLTEHVEEDCGFIKQDKLLLLEIFYYVFLGQDPEVLAKSFKKGCQVDFAFFKLKFQFFCSLNIDSYDEYAHQPCVSCFEQEPYVNTCDCWNFNDQRAAWDAMHAIKFMDKSVVQLYINVINKVKIMWI